MLSKNEFDQWSKSGDNSQEDALHALQYVKELEAEAKKARETAYKKLEVTDRSKWKEEVDGFRIENASPVLTFSLSSEDLLLLEKTNPDLFHAVAQTGIKLDDKAKADLEAEKEDLDAREAEISALLESDRLAREPQLINSPVTAKLLKSHGIEPETKVVRKASWKVVAYKPKADKAEK
jgi:hypothetical protein